MFYLLVFYYGAFYAHFYVGVDDRNGFSSIQKYKCIKYKLIEMCVKMLYLFHCNHLGLMEIKTIKKGKPELTFISYV